MTDLKSASVSEISAELRARGCAVVVFTPEDVPDWYDYTAEGGAESWFGRQVKHLEERLSEDGNEALDMYASYDGLPAVVEEDDDEVS